MPKLINIEIIFNGSHESNKLNMELITYFKQKINIINQAGIKIIWRIVTKQEYPIYKKKGIKHYPALIKQDESIIYGVKNITTELNKSIQRNANKLAISNGMNEVSDEALYEYQLKAIGKAGDDDEQTEDFDNTFRKRQMDMINRRQAAGLEIPTASISTQSPENCRPADYSVKLPNSSPNYSFTDNPDNIPMSVEPIASLNKIRNKSNSKDIDLMQMHLDKMGGSEHIPMEYF